MKEEIKIVYQDYVSKELINKFEVLGAEKFPDMKVVLEKAEKVEYLNASGPLVTDVLVFIQQHESEINHYILEPLIQILIQESVMSFFKDKMEKISFCLNVEIRSSDFSIKFQIDKNENNKKNDSNYFKEKQDEVMEK